MYTFLQILHFLVWKNGEELFIGIFGGVIWIIGVFIMYGLIMEEKEQK